MTYEFKVDIAIVKDMNKLIRKQMKAIDAVMNLHKPSNKGFDWMPLDYCDVCIEDPGDYQPTNYVRYPCPTIQALHAELA